MYGPHLSVCVIHLCACCSNSSHSTRSSKRPTTQQCERPYKIVEQSLTNPIEWRLCISFNTFITAIRFCSSVFFSFDPEIFDSNRLSRKNMILLVYFVFSSSNSSKSVFQIHNIQCEWQFAWRLNHFLSNCHGNFETVNFKSTVYEC